MATLVIEDLPQEFILQQQLVCGTASIELTRPSVMEQTLSSAPVIRLHPVPGQGTGQAPLQSAAS